MRNGITCFIHNGNWYLAELTVDVGGRIEYWGLHTFKEFLQDVEKGWVGVVIPDGAELRIGDIGDFVVKLGKTHDRITGKLMFTHQWMTNQDFVAEVADRVRARTGKPTSGQVFDAAWGKWNQDPSEKNRKVLKAAYLEVPAHTRRFLLGDMDMKDGPIISAINEGFDIHKAPTVFRGL